MKFGRVFANSVARFLRVQYGSAIGDLIWGPTESRSIELPDASGTVKLSHWSNPQRAVFFDHFLNNVNGALVYAVAGAGASNAITAVHSRRPGVLQHETGTTATGQAGCRTAATPIVLGSAPAFFRALVRFPTLSTGTESYVYRIGFMDSITGEPIDGLYFRYSDNASLGLGSIQAVARSNNVESVGSFGGTPSTTDWYDLVIRCDSASFASFYLTQISTSDVLGPSLMQSNVNLETNIPATVARSTGVASSLIKLAGTTSRSVQVDFLCAEVG